ncbi:MAG: hypothetical protein ACRD10_08485 [Terriglobia bacterium]
MNRIDRVIVFRTLQPVHLQLILDIELTRVQERIMASTGDKQFVFKCTNPARDFLLREGTDAKSGARHLKRAIERHLVFPLSNLIATGQIALGDFVMVDHSIELDRLTFFKQEHGALVIPPEESGVGMALVPISVETAMTTTALARRASE